MVIFQKKKTIFSDLKKGGEQNLFWRKNISPNDENSPQKEKLELVRGSMADNRPVE
jgi:hypothetical protein